MSKRSELTDIENVRLEEVCHSPSSVAITEKASPSPVRRKASSPCRSPTPSPCSSAVRVANPKAKAFAKRRSLSLLSSDSDTHLQAYTVRKSFNRPKTWVLTFGWFLAACAGYVNTVAFLTWKMFVSHMTGTSTKIGMHIEGFDHGDNESQEIFKALGLIISFVLGSFACGLLVDKNQVHFGGKSWYGFALLLTGLLLVVATSLPEMPTTSCYLAATACGLQNAMCTSHFGAVVRTTHVTGTLTDIGSILGRIAMIYLRKGCRRSRMNVLDKAEIGVDARKLLVLLPMWSCFVIGSTFGAFAERVLGKDALFIPAFATSFLGFVYMTLRTALADLFQKFEQQSLRERLQEVHGLFQRTGSRIAESGMDSTEMDDLDEELGDMMDALDDVSAGLEATR